MYSNPYLLQQIARQRSPTPSAGPASHAPVWPVPTAARSPTEALTLVCTRP